MSKFDERINELFETLTEAALLNTIINTIIVFLVSYILFSLINLIPIALATIVSMIYLLNIWIIKRSFYDIKLVEKKFPFLKERLSTAKDTLNRDNFVINALRIDVSRRINHIDASTFFRTTRTITKIFVILFLLFGLMFFTANDIKIVNLNEKLNEWYNKFINLFTKNNEEKENEFEIIDKTDPTRLDDEREFKREEFISQEDIDAIGSTEYRDTISDEEKEIVKKYFETIITR